MVLLAGAVDYLGEEGHPPGGGEEVQVTFQWGWLPRGKGGLDGL